jgi:hypothetical protein
MERGTWTEERLDDRFDQIDRRFDQVERRFDRVDGGLRDLRGEINELRTTILRVGGGMMAGLVGVIAAILARGV